MLLNIAALVPVVIGVFAAQHIDGTIVEGYRKHETAVDKSSWSYSDTDSGLDGACSVANKCGPASWSKVNIQFLLMGEFELIRVLLRMTRSSLLADLKTNAQDRAKHPSTLIHYPLLRIALSSILPSPRKMVVAGSGLNLLMTMHLKSIFRTQGMHVKTLMSFTKESSINCNRCIFIHQPNTPSPSDILMPKFI